MPHSHKPTSKSAATIAALAQPRSFQSLGPIAARFVYSLRLIALHQKAKRDPIPELTMRLNSVNVAAKALNLSQTVTAVWPEHLHVSRFCCCRLTHDEATIADMIEAATGRDPDSFRASLDGFVRKERCERLWETVVELVEAELTAV